MNPGLIASYNLRPGNGEGLFWFQRFINLSVTYLLRQLPTYLQPGTHMGPRFSRISKHAIILKKS